MMPKKDPRIPVLLIVGFLAAAASLAGCGQSLDTLATVGAEQDAQHLWVKKETARFERLLEDVRAGRLTPGARMADITARYGPPVLVRDAEGSEAETGARKTLLFRNPAVFFNTPKVYLDFDAQDSLIIARVKDADAS